MSTDHTPIVIKGMIALGILLMIVAVWKDIIKVGL